MGPAWAGASNVPLVARASLSSPNRIPNSRPRRSRSPPESDGDSGSPSIAPLIAADGGEACESARERFWSRLKLSVIPLWENPRPGVITSVKRIPIHYRRHGLERNLVARSGDAVMYSVVHSNAEVMGYDVMRVRRTEKDYRFPDGTVQRTGDERLPTTLHWGTHGWTCRTLSDALRRFEELAAGQAGRMERKQACPPKNGASPWKG